MSKGVVIGLSNVVYAPLTTDPTSGTATYGTPVPIAGAMKATINPNQTNDTIFADDGPYDTATALGKIEVDLEMADLSLETQAALFGHTIDANGVLIRRSTDIPPWVALGFKTLKSNGKYRYTWLAKGKFSAPEQANETRGDKINWKTQPAKGSFVKRDCDNEWERHIDEDSTTFQPTQAANWFNNPYGTATV